VKTTWNAERRRCTLLLSWVTRAECQHVERVDFSPVFFSDSCRRCFLIWLICRPQGFQRNISVFQLCWFDYVWCVWWSKCHQISIMLVPCHIPHASTPPPFHAIPCLGMDALFLRERLHGADAGGCKGASGQDDHSRAYGLALCRLGRCIGGSLRLVSDVSGKQMVNQLWLIHGDLSFSLPFFFSCRFLPPFHLYCPWSFQVGVSYQCQSGACESPYATSAHMRLDEWNICYARARCLTTPTSLLFSSPISLYHTNCFYARIQFASQRIIVSLQYPAVPRA